MNLNFNHLSHLSKIPGIGGKIKSIPEDFIVEEISEDGTIFELNKIVTKSDYRDYQDGKFIHFILQKKNWATSSALLEMGKRLHIHHKNFGIAGTKDKQAITTQLVSISNIEKEKLYEHYIKINDISINGAWRSNKKMSLGDLLGNRFTIRIRDSDESSENIEEKIKQIYSDLNGIIPNYFGEQRFGSTRKNTHLIGLKILEADFKEAVNIFLCADAGGESPKTSAARQKLKENGNYPEALKAFPKHLRLERIILAHLSIYPEDYVGALKKLPRATLLLFIHAVQSYLFNLLLSERISESHIELEEGEFFCGEINGFPALTKFAASGFLVGKIIGYKTILNEREKRFLENFGLKTESFRSKVLPELSSKGTRRLLLAPVKDFSFCNDTFYFILPAGSYATVVLREFMDKKEASKSELQ